MKVSHQSFELKGLSNKLIGGQMIKVITRARNRVKEIEVSIAWGTGLIAIGLALIVVSLRFHYSLFAMVLTWVMFFSTGIGGWLLGRGTKR